MPPTIQQESKNKSIFLMIGVFVLLLIVIFVMQGSFGERGKKVEEQAKTKENIVVTKVNLAEASADSKLPVGFPPSIPVEINSITESLTADFPDRGVTQYSVTYEASESQKQIWNKYLAYMNAQKYTFGANGKNEKEGYLYGTKDKNDLSVVVAVQSGKTEVHITFIGRK